MSDRAASDGVPFWGDGDDGQALASYRALVDAVDDGIYQLDAEGRFVGANEKIAAVTGYAREDLLGEHVSIVLDDADVERIERDVRKRLESGEPTGVATYELPIETADGTALTCESRTSFLVADGEFRGSIGIVRDVTERKRRERHIEAELSEVVDRITDGFIALDADWTITHINEQGKALLDAADRDLIGENLWEEFPTVDGTSIKRAYRRAMETQEPTTIEEYYPPLGVWFEDHIYPSETGLSVYFRDVTERKERERTLAKYRTIVETVNDGIYTVDADGRFTMVNDAYAELTGYSREELLGSHVSLVVDDETIRRAKAAEMGLLEGRNRQPVEETVLQTADGERVPAEATFTMLPGDTHERIGVARDITDRKERERALEESERRYRTLVENFPNGAVGLFDETFAYTVAGGEFLDDLGIVSADIVGETIYERYPDDLVERIKPSFAAVFEGESNAFEVEYRDRNLLAHTLPVRDAADEIYAGMLMVQDVTERTQYRHDLEESNERLEQFAYAASHDLQEPLRMVSSYLRLLESRYADELDEDAEDFIAFAVDGADRMREMIEGLLEYSRIETQGDPFEPVALDDVFADTVETLQVRIAESDAEIAADPLPQVRGDERQLRQLFQNLLDNGIEYCGDAPPRIHVSAERREARSVSERSSAERSRSRDGDAVSRDDENSPGEFSNHSAAHSSGAGRERGEGLDEANGEAVSGLRGGETASNETAEPSPSPREDDTAAENDGAEWELSIRDEGEGIDPDDHERIFEVFHRLHSHEEHAGAGIGLALCERIVERHGGEIRVDSEPGEGTTVSVTLPAVEP